MESRTEGLRPADGLVCLLSCPGETGDSVEYDTRCTVPDINRRTVYGSWSSDINSE